MTSVEEIQGVDLATERRPGYQSHRTVAPWPNARIPPSCQVGDPAVPFYARGPEPGPPVFGTACPLRGPSGLVRKIAYRYPDHEARRWLLLLFADRVEATGPRLRRASKFGLPLLAFPLLAGGALAAGWRRSRRHPARFAVRATARAASVAH
jgi:hypothetical protein